MAKIQPLADFILSFEGGYVNHPNDKGGPTNMGVTLKTWQTQGYDKNHDGRIDANDVKLITKADAVSILAVVTGTDGKPMASKTRVSPTSW